MRWKVRHRWTLLTHLFPRQHLEKRIREIVTPRRLLLIRAGGILPAALEFGRALAEELTGAVIRRFRNPLPAATAVAREGLVAAIEMEPEEAGLLAAQIATNLAGPYACMKTERRSGRQAPQVRLLDSVPGAGEETLGLSDEFLAA